jgi:hypothetical protein
MSEPILSSNVSKNLLTCEQFDPCIGFDQREYYHTQLGTLKPPKNHKSLQCNSLRTMYKTYSTQKERTWLYEFFFLFMYLTLKYYCVRSVNGNGAKTVKTYCLPTLYHIFEYNILEIRKKSKRQNRSPKDVHVFKVFTCRNPTSTRGVVAVLHSGGCNALISLQSGFCLIYFPY